MTLSTKAIMTECGFYNICKRKICNNSCPITSWQTEEEKAEAVIDFIFLDSKITGDSKLQPGN